jgi:putative transposase
LSRKKKGSHNREKMRLKVARFDEKIKNPGIDFLHKLSYKVISENQAIYLEDLHVKGMIRSKNLSKAISDSGWGEFIRQLQYKALWDGRKLRQIPRYYPSSKECSICHFVIPELKLSQRVWACPNCKTVHDRDINASVVIKQVGRDTSKLPPVERLISTSLTLSMKQIASMKQETHASQASQ